ncbi:unnamed protein product, partial [marine sediment metagenome]
IGHAGGSGSGSRTVGAGQGLNVGESLTVGYDAAGVLTISNGGLVENTLGFIGDAASSTGTVTVDNGTWNNSSNLLVGYYGSGELTISNGGQVANTYGNIGYWAGSTGTVTVDGGIWTNRASLNVGGGSSAGGIGLLNVSNSGTVNVADTLKVWPGGTVELLGGQTNTESLIVESGGTLILDRGELSTVNLTGSGTFRFDSGTLRLEGGEISLAGPLDIHGDGT